MKFSIRDLFLVTVIVALLIVGFAERNRLISHYEWLLRDEHEKRNKAEEELGSRQIALTRIGTMPKWKCWVPDPSASVLNPPND